MRHQIHYCFTFKIIVIMLYQELVEQIFKKRSFLCVGLDPDYEKIPLCLKANNPKVPTADLIAHFICDIIDATDQYAVAYKPNLAFFERYGAAGLKALELIVKYIRDEYPEIFIIADAKRGDIGNTASQYAKAVFEHLKADAVTLNPYMGFDSVAPFLTFKDSYEPEKHFWSVILALTSNQGSFDFQMIKDKHGIPLYQHVLTTTSGWKESSFENTMYVVGATRAEMLTEIRKIVPRHFLLVPGVGAQGGSLEEVAKYGMTPDCGLLVNSSRGILYASNNDGYAHAASEAAHKLQQKMNDLLPRR